MSRWRQLGLVVAVALAGFGPTAPAVAQKYVAVGDSITFGFGDDKERTEKGYPPRLEDLLVARGRTATVTNEGISGETTAEALSRINRVLAPGFDVLLLMEGTNDVNLRLSPETIRFNLDAIAQRAELRGMSVVHATVVPRLPTANFDGRNLVTKRLAEEIRAIAHGARRGLVDPFEIFITTLDGFNRLYAGGDDNLHPNAAGYDLLAVSFADVLTDIDTRPPVLGRVFPADDAQNVASNVEVSVEVYDFGAGLDLPNTTLLLDDVPVTATVVGDARRLTLTYQPAEGFRGVPAIGLRTRDTAPTVHVFDDVVTQFVIAGTVFLAGDLNRDGRVDGTDLVNLAVRFGSISGDGRYLSTADLNGDRRIDGADLAVLASNFGRSS